MFTWIVDNASLFYLLFLFAGLGLLAGWWTTRDRRYLAGLGGVAAAACLVWLLTLVIVTDRAEITRVLHDMARGMEDKQPDRAFAHVSERFSSPFLLAGGQVTWNKRQLRDAFMRAKRGYGVEEILIKDVDFLDLGDREAKVAFRAKPVIGDFTTPFFPCEARFVREGDGKWRMIGLKVFNPFVNTNQLYQIPLR